LFLGKTSKYIYFFISRNPLFGNNSIVKHRYRVDVQGKRHSIDVFQGHLTGLILAEVEAETVAEIKK